MSMHYDLNLAKAYMMTGTVMTHDIKGLPKWQLVVFTDTVGV